MWKETLQQILQHLRVPNTDQLIEEYRAAYSQPHRRYHNLEHVNYLLSALTAVPQPSPALLMAALYHFFFYDATRDDNEKRSADYLRTKLQAAGVNANFIDAVTAIMLAPINSVDMSFSSVESQHLADADMSIYGESPEVYNRYIAAVREEFGNLGDFNWYQTRVRFLLGLLKQNRIFHTEEFYSKFEKHARSNMATELITMIDSYERTILRQNQPAGVA